MKLYANNVKIIDDNNNVSGKMIFISQFLFSSSRVSHRPRNDTIFFFFFIPKVITILQDK